MYSLPNETNALRLSHCLETSICQKLTSIGCSKVRTARALSLCGIMITHQHVRQALRYFDCERNFAGTDVGRRLLRAYPGQPPRDTFVSVVCSAFDCADARDALELRGLIFESDLENAVPRSTAARRMNTSLRSFYRKRSRAIAYIAQYLDRLLDDDDAGTLAAFNAPEPAQSGVNSPHFQNVRSRYERHRICGDLVAMQDELAALAGYSDVLTDTDAVERALMEVETAISAGTMVDASRQLTLLLREVAARGDRRLRAFALLLQATLSLCLGKLQHARELATAIVDTFAQEAGIRSRAAILAARAAVLSGQQPSTGEMGVPANEHDALYLRAIAARGALLAGRSADAYEASLQVFQTSRAHGTLPIAAYSAATIACCCALGASGSQDAWAVTALKLLASCGCAADVAKDLFQFGRLEAPRFLLAPALKSGVADIYKCLQPSSALNSLPAFGDLATDLLHAVIAHAAFGRISPESEQHLVEAAYAAGSESGCAAPIAKEVSSLRAFGEFLKCMAPAPQQGAYAQRFSSSAGIVVRSVTRALSHRRIRALSLVS